MFAGSKRFRDVRHRLVRLTGERLLHWETSHPEMRGQVNRVEDVLRAPDLIVRSRTDPEVELFYRHYRETPVTEKYLCVVVKSGGDDAFIITAYFTDSVKKGEVLWEKRR